MDRRGRKEQEARKKSRNEFQNLTLQKNIITAIKSRSMTWVWHVVRTGEMRDSYKI
jgi:hypothetical protein